MEGLDQERLAQLLREADDKWSSIKHPNQYNYQEHINFTAGYIAKNYNRRKQ